MNNWHAFPKGGWSFVGKVLSGFGDGEGSYGIAYAIDQGIGSFLNGRVSARVRLAGNRPFNGAGVVCRASELRSFAAFYLVTDDTTPELNLYSVRLAGFKFGKLNALVGLKHPIQISRGEFQIALQFFSGEMVGQVETGAETYTLKYVLPDPPFPGSGGVVRFYNSSVTMQNIHIEKITMKPILPEDDTGTPVTYPFQVFLSHASVDKAVVLKVVEAFRSAGIRYWVDHEQITFGDGIVAKIEEGLRKSRYVVVCLSDSLAASGWCRAEYGPILYREFSGDTARRVIPLSLDGSKKSDSIPLLLSDKMRADLTDPNSFSSFLKFLREAAQK